MSKRLAWSVILLLVIVSIGLLGNLYIEDAYAANGDPQTIYAVEDTTIIYEGTGGSKIMYEDGNLGYLDVSYQGTFGVPLEVQVLLKYNLPDIPEGYEVESANLYFPMIGGNIQGAASFSLKASSSLNHDWIQDTIASETLPAPIAGSTIARSVATNAPIAKPVIGPFDFTSYVSNEIYKTNPRATFILSAFTAEQAAAANITFLDHYIQSTETHLNGTERPYLIITYTEMVNIEITGVTDGSFYRNNVTPHFNVGTATLNGAPFTLGTTITNEGTYTLTVTQGNQTQTIQFTIDKTRPTATVVINNGSSFTNREYVDVRITPDSGVNDIVYMRYSVNDSPVSTPQAYQSHFLIGVGTGNGEKSVRIELIDAAGNESPLYSWDFALNTTIPKGNLTINSGAAYTTKREVDLLIAPDTGANEIVSMRFSTDNIYWSTIESYNPSKTYTLPSGDGNKTVYVQLLDRFGNLGVLQSSILLDMTPPTASVLINNGDEYANNINVAIEITPDTGVNDIAAIRYTLNGLPPTTIAYTNSFAINVGSTNGEKEITITLIDAAGHTSTVYRETVTLDTLPPTGTVAINGGATYATDAKVSLGFSLGVNVDDVVGVQFSNDDRSWSVQQSYSASTSYTLPTGDGNKTVYVRFIDRAGNIGTAQASIVLDTTAPTTTPTPSPSPTSNVNIKFGENGLEVDFTGQVNIQGNSISIHLTENQLTQLSAEQQNQPVVLSISATYPNAQLVLEKKALEKLVENGNSIVFSTTGVQFILSNQELKQMLTNNRSSFIINIQQASAELIAKAQEQAIKGAYQIIGTPVTIELLAQNDEDSPLNLPGLGQLVLNSTNIGNNIPLTMLLNASSVGDKIWPTALLKLLPNGELTPVLAAISINGQSYRVDVTNYGAGTYTLISKQPQFTDVSGWSKEAIELLASKLILNGVDATTFEPDRAITRAEFANIINKALGLVNTSNTSAFTDITADAWYADAIATVAELGFMNGYTDGTYRPSQQLTREEAMVIVARVLSYLESNLVLSSDEIYNILAQYGDQDQLGNWSRLDIALTVREGIIMGNNGQLNAKDNITREQIAAIIVRLLERTELL